MHELNFPYEVSISTDQECEYISDEITHFKTNGVRKHS